MKYIFLTLVLLMSPFVSANDKFAMEMITSNSSGGWGAIRFETETGKSWLIKGGIFVEIAERRRLAKGKYIINMVTTRKGWSATRMDV